MMSYKERRKNSSISYPTSNSITSSSSDSYSSRNSFENPSKDDFIVTDPFNQLLDDLSLIDNFIPDYNDFEEIQYEQQVADAARDVAQKQFTVHRLCQFEQDQVIGFVNLLTFYIEPLTQWVNDPNNTTIFQKFPECSLRTLIEVSKIIAILTKVHQSFSQSLKERLSIWGPTQFISDLFSDFYEKTMIYENYIKLFPELILTINTLYKKPSTFPAFIDHCMAQAIIPDIKDILYYFKSPLVEIHNYQQFVSSLSGLTDPSHPDYKPLAMLNAKYSQRESQWKPIITDRLAHFRVLEASRSIQDNPAYVTSTRRLLISGLLAKVDLSNPHSTADTRTYLLYNDLFIFTQKLKQTHQTDKLVYKGTLPLKHAEVHPLSPKTIAKVSEIKRSVSRSFMKSKADAKEQHQVTQMYGFELHVSDTDSHQFLLENGYNGVGRGLHTTVPGESNSSSKKLFIMRTQTEAEQNAWIHLISKVSKEVSRKK